MIPRFMTELIDEYRTSLEKHGISLTFEIELFINGLPLRWPEKSGSLKPAEPGTIVLTWEGQSIGSYHWQGSLNSTQEIIHRLLLDNLILKLKVKLTEQQFDCGIGVLNSAIKAIEAKDHYTGGHSDRVAALALEIADQLKTDMPRFDIEFAAKLHDIGKIGISEVVLLKPGSLNSDELAEIRKHPEIGAQILAPLSFFAHLVPVIRHHHERYDGAGYPDRLTGDKIPLLSRIISVADTFDALTSDRPYRKALGLDRARDIISKERGTQFDPNIIDAFLDLPTYVLTHLRAS